MRFCTALLTLILLCPPAHAGDMDFGAIEFVPGSSSLSAIMDVSNGALICLNQSYSCQRFGTRGSYLVTGVPGTTVSISCDSKGVVSNGILNLTINSIFVLIGNVPSLCVSVLVPSTIFSLTGIQASNVLYLAGKLFVPGGTPASKLIGTYSSSHTGGQPITVRLIYF